MTSQCLYRALSVVCRKTGTTTTHVNGRCVPAIQHPVIVRICGCAIVWMKRGPSLILRVLRYSYCILIYQSNYLYLDAKADHLIYTECE